jgi:alkylhydroperoxidase family enzyme
VQFATTLSTRQRELLVLRVATVRRAEYEWAQHVVIGRDNGLDDADFARIAEGPDAAGWDPLERAMVAAVDELLADARIADGTWDVLRREPRRQAAHGPGVHRRRLRGAGHGAPHVRRPARRRPEGFRPGAAERK